jgi:hypothetical protein
MAPMTKAGRGSRLPGSELDMGSWAFAGLVWPIMAAGVVPGSFQAAADCVGVRVEF